jgi:hypothetical protein
MSELGGGILAALALLVGCGAWVAWERRKRRRQR